MKTRHYFASANTNDNFINFFDYVLDNSIQSFRYVIKGSSGCGKSTLMKKIAKHFLEQGCNIEYFYCSSDPSSLDGIRIIPHNVCIVDGTSPHATEAKIPGVTDKIINLGEFIDDNVANNAKIIKEILKEKSNNYSKIYLYLQSIGCLDKIVRNNYLNYSSDDISNCILSNCASSFKKGNLRKLFINLVEEGMKLFESFNVKIMPYDNHLDYYLFLQNSLKGKIYRHKMMNLLKKNNGCVCSSILYDLERNRKNCEVLTVVKSFVNHAQLKKIKIPIINSLYQIIMDIKEGKRRINKNIYKEIIKW